MDKNKWVLKYETDFGRCMLRPDTFEHAVQIANLLFATCEEIVVIRIYLDERDEDGHLTNRYLKYVNHRFVR